MDARHPTTLFATSAASAGAWLLDSLYRYGPSWSLVPPILLALASVLGAVRSYQDGAQARRHADARLRAELAAGSASTNGRAGP